MKQLTIFTLLALLAVACNTPDNGGEVTEKELPNETMQLEREAFSFANPETRTPAYSVAST